MSLEADLVRDKRRYIARPGGGHDKIVRFLAILLPALIGALAAVMILAPLSPRGEISFLLDRNKVDVAQDRLKVENAMYRGQDAKGRPFSLNAGEAVQRNANESLVRMKDLEARILMEDGPATLTAQSGRYRIDEEIVDVDGIVRFTAADGYSLTARDVRIDLNSRQASGTGRIEGSAPEGTLGADQIAVDLKQRTASATGRIEGTIPAGTFSADQMQVNLEQRRIQLNGNVRMRMVPGKLRMP